MTNEIDWDNAPEGAEYFAAKTFYKRSIGMFLFWHHGEWLNSDRRHSDMVLLEDYQERPQQKPRYEYGVEYQTNGRKPELPDDVLVCIEGQSYESRGSVDGWDWPRVESFRIVDERYKAAAATVEHKAPTTSTEFLTACAQVQSERAKQYDASGTGERSFDAAAEAFNCVTGKNLRGSDVCLILEMVKLVRQYSDPTRLHGDSVLDKVSYASLWAEELTKELR